MRFDADKTLDRLKDLEVDSFDRESQFSELGSMKDYPRNRTNDPHQDMMDAIFVPKAKNSAFIADTVSEINDEREKNAIFSHSLKHGVFNDIRNSPLRRRMPVEMQVYNPALEKRLFAKQSDGL